MANNPKHIAKGGKLPKMTDEEKMQAIFRQYSQKFSVYMEAAVFNMLGNSHVVQDLTHDEIIANAADIAEKLIDALPEAVNAAFNRRMERAAKLAKEQEAEQ